MNTTVETGPRYQYCRINIQPKPTIHRIPSSLIRVPIPNVPLVKTNCIVRIDVSDKRVLESPTWYVRDDDYILADWLEDMRDCDDDKKRKLEATYSLLSLRNYCNDCVSY